MSPESSPTERAREVMASAYVKFVAEYPGPRHVMPTTAEKCEAVLAALLAEPELLLSVMEEAGTMELAGFWCPWKRFIEAEPGDEQPNEKYMPLYRVVYRKAETDE